MNEEPNRWAIYIDIQGTSKRYPKDAPHFHAGFDQLLNAIYLIGSSVYPESPLRLFVHQVGGDGLVIVSDGDEGTPERFVSIAVVLMQVLLANGSVGKAAIAKGTFADIRGCWPSLREAPPAGNATFRLGSGLLTTLPVMGTALIKPHEIAESLPKGSLLALDPALVTKSLPGVIISNFGGPIVIDWIHTKTPITDMIDKKTGLGLRSQSELEKKLVAYVVETGALANSDWGRNTLSFNGCKPV